MQDVSIPKLYASHHGNHNCGRGYQLQLTSIIGRYLRMYCKTWNRIWHLLTTKLCYTSSTEGVVQEIVGKTSSLLQYSCITTKNTADRPKSSFIEIWERCSPIVQYLACILWLHALLLVMWPLRCNYMKTKSHALITMSSQSCLELLCACIKPIFWDIRMKWKWQMIISAGYISHYD